MFRFTIRDLLWLTVVAAMGVGWWVDHTRISTANNELAKQRDNESRIAQLRALEIDRKIMIGRSP